MCVCVCLCESCLLQSWWEKVRVFVCVYVCVLPCECVCFGKSFHMFVTECVHACVCVCFHVCVVPCVSASVYVLVYVGACACASPQDWRVSNFWLNILRCWNRILFSGFGKRFFLRLHLFLLLHFGFINLATFKGVDRIMWVGWSSGWQSRLTTEKSWVRFRQHPQFSG